MVPSISPVDGNDPSFTVARVNPATAQMVDYEVIAGSNKTGVDTVWQKEYSFGKTYHEKVFSPVTVGKLLGEFGTDLDARGEMSRAYLTNYLAELCVCDGKPYGERFCGVRVCGWQVGLRE
jgi:sphingomyelin phosphodiesterase acid-like 3